MDPNTVRLLCENAFRAEMITFPAHREPANTVGTVVERIPTSEFESGISAVTATGQQGPQIFSFIHCTTVYFLDILAEQCYPLIKPSN